MVHSRLIVALALLAGSGAAMAHSGHHGAGFATGFAHPFSGLDHLLAMVAVGLFATRMQGASRVAVPGAFVLAMIVGALAGAGGVFMPLQEAGIAASLLVFGLALAVALRAPTALALPMVAFFGLFHGSAHFAEMGAGSLVTYMAGFVAATAALHAAGFALGQWMPRSSLGRVAKRATGVAIATTGAIMLGA
ncbi:HupE/UreJ family protein [Nitrogeniibacter aestuarii]|uniref:HupE/UreJ family protein n=1 Tax=Nitrogeniibacter aestuarii TaxID=2815343 RepID=UPI001E3FCB1D|nr:HupE/UreJ family protein [Nitrogeniibacter aestuarii]